MTSQTQQQRTFIQTNSCRQTNHRQTIFTSLRGKSTRLSVAGDSEKRTRWWSQEVKKAIRAKKDAFKALLQDRSSSDLLYRYIEAQKAATSAVKKSQKSWEEFGRRLDSYYFFAHKVFRRPSAVFMAKDRVSRTSSRILRVTF